MPKITGRYYIRRLEIVDDTDSIIYRIKDKPFEKGMQGALDVIWNKDGKRSVSNIFQKFSKYLDKDFKKLFDMEE